MKYKLGICTRFRDAVEWKGNKLNHIDKYFAQIFSQRHIDMDEVGIFLLEGNSSDNTYDKLVECQDTCHMHLFKQEELVKTDIVTISGSTEDSSRLRMMGQLGAALLNKARTQCESVIWMESDLIYYNHNLFHKLLKGANELDSIVAPWTWIRPNGQYMFYDIWAYRNLDGSCWHFRTVKPEIPYVEMSSIGSCCAIPRCILESSANFGDNEFLDFCKSVKDNGFKVHVDPNLEVEHPGNAYINNRWI